MLKVLAGKKVINGLPPYAWDGYKHIVVDMGTGDGRFIYKMAQKNPDTYYIGVDPMAENMAEYAVRVLKKPAKGGLPNVTYVVSSIEALPRELYGVASHIHINMPWGSLLEGIVKCSDAVIDNLVNLAAGPRATLDIHLAYTDRYESNEIQKRELPALSQSYLENELAEKLLAKGVLVTSVAILDNDALRNQETLWAKRLGFGKMREVYRICATIG